MRGVRAFATAFAAALLVGCASAPVESARASLPDDGFESDPDVPVYVAIMHDDGVACPTYASGGVCCAASHWHVRVAGHACTVAELAAHLPSGPGPHAARLRVDRAAPYERVHEVIAALASAHFDVGLGPAAPSASEAAPADHVRLLLERAADGTLVRTLQPDGTVFVAGAGGDPALTAALRARLAALPRGGRDVEVKVAAVADAPWGPVVESIQAVRRAGVVFVAFAPPQPPACVLELRHRAEPCAAAAECVDAKHWVLWHDGVAVTVAELPARLLPHGGSGATAGERAAALLAVALVLRIDGSTPADRVLALMSECFENGLVQVKPQVAGVESAAPAVVEGDDWPLPTEARELVLELAAPDTGSAAAVTLQAPHRSWVESAADTARLGAWLRRARLTRPADAPLSVTIKIGRRVRWRSVQTVVDAVKQAGIVDFECRYLPNTPVR